MVTRGTIKECSFRYDKMPFRTSIVWFTPSILLLLLYINPITLLLNASSLSKRSRKFFSELGIPWWYIGTTNKRTSACIICSISRHCCSDAESRVKYLPLNNSVKFSSVTTYELYPNFLAMICAACEIFWLLLPILFVPLMMVIFILFYEPL